MKRRRKRRVAHDPRLLDARALRIGFDDLAHGVEVCQPAGRVGRRLGVDDARVGLERLCVILGVGRVDESVLHAPMPQEFHKELVRAAVYRVREDGVITFLERCGEGAGDSRHTRGEEHAAAVVGRPNALERCDLTGRALVCWRSPASVDVAISVCVWALPLCVKTSAMSAVLHFESRTKHDRERDRLDSADREVRYLDHTGAPRLVPKLVPVLSRRANRHALAHLWCFCAAVTIQRH